jgi:iron complex transport system substrate-binding protein
MKHRNLLVVPLVALVALAAAWGISLLLDDPTPPEAERAGIIALSPPITETLFEIGAGDLLIARSDYCNFPPDARNLPMAGTALTPNTEAIARLKPAMVFADDSVATARDKLPGLAPTTFLPWLTAEDVINSTRELGRLTGHVDAANRLADDLAAQLLKPPPTDGPRVLLVMTGDPGAGAITFLKRNSLHGRMLHAAGGRNAVDRDEPGVPRISLEEVLRLDPEFVIVLVYSDEMSDAEREQVRDNWRRVAPLSAVENNRIGVLYGEHFYGAGRRLLRAVDELREEIQRLERHGE